MATCGGKTYHEGNLLMQMIKLGLLSNKLKGIMEILPNQVFLDNYPRQVCFSNCKVDIFP